MPGKQLFVNNGKGKLNAGILAGDTTLTLQAGQGALFPAPAGGDFFRFTLIDNAGNIEVCYCTARAADVLNPIARGQEGTVARAFNAADKVEVRWTRDSANQYQQRTDVQRNIARFAGVVGGTADALTATLASDLKTLQDGMRVDAEALLANASTAPTLNVTLGPAFDGTSTATGAKTIKKFAASPLAAGDMAGPGHRLMFEYRAADDAWYLLNPAGALSRALVSVRHAIQAAKLDANGYNAAFAAGTGLAVDLSATATPMNVSFANGFDSQGPFELVTQIAADAASAVASIAASNTTFLHATWSSLSAVTWSKCLIPPQYGFVFDRTQAALMNFEGANGSTTFLDDFGNTWTPNGNAQITTAQSKFGASSMLLDGVGDFISNTQITTLGDASWEISLWFRINALPGVGLTSTLWRAYNAGTFGSLLRIENNAGVVKLSFFASSNGTAYDIASAVLGTNTVWTLNQWNKARVVFDSLAGTYRVYLSLNGAAETQDITVSSSAKLCNFTTFRIGADNAGAQEFNGWIDAFRLVRCASNTSTETPSASAPAIGDLPVHFFSIPQMKMLEATGVSPGVGQDPVFTQRNRVFAGEVDTGGAAVSAVRNYAVRGAYRKDDITNAVLTVTSFNHNIGVRPRRHRQRLINRVADAGYTVNEELEVTFLFNSTIPEGRGPSVAFGRTSGVLANSTSSAIVAGKVTGAYTGLVVANWTVSIDAERGW